jgi:hypothetical protein
MSRIEGKAEVAGAGIPACAARPWAKIIMAQPSPLSALCTAKEGAVVIEAGPRVESFLNAKGWLRRKSSAAMSCFESSRATETC